MRHSKTTRRILAATAAACLLCLTNAQARKTDKPPGGGDETAPFALVDLLGIPESNFLQSNAVAVSEPDSDNSVLVVGDSNVTFEQDSELDHEFHPAFWNVSADGSFPINQIDLGIPPGALSAWASDVNDAGLITVNAAGSDGETRAFIVFPNGASQELPMLGAVAASAQAVNNYGDIVGSIVFDDGVNREAFGALWILDEYGMVDDPIDLGSFMPFDVSNSGLMVGQDALDYIAAIAWFDAGTNLQVEPLGALPGHTEGRANAVSSDGTWVAGQSGGPNGEAFLWSADTGMIGLGTLGGSSSTAEGVNNSGQVVGSSATGSQKHSVAAFLWQDGRMFNLNDLVNTGGGKTRIHLPVVWDINNAGHIAGLMRIGISDVDEHGCLLIPNVP